jgi:hypothetical protein
MKYKFFATFLVLMSLTAFAAAPFPIAAPRPAGAPAAGPPGPPQWVVLDAELAKADFRPGEPVTLELTLRNASAEAISIWETTPTADFEIRITAPGGARVRLSEYGRNARIRSENGGRRETLTIKPGEKRRVVIDLGRAYDIREAGRYSLVATRTFFVEGRDTLNEVSSPAVSFRMLEAPGRKKRGSGARGE